MSGLIFTFNDEDFEIDEFYKSLMFQEIMDGGFSRNERDVMLVIFRKTVHFNKWSDRIGNHWLCKAVGIGENTLRATLRQLEAKGLIDIKRSSGGRSISPKRFSLFSLSDEFATMVFNRWLKAKEENGFFV
ncbi:MAG: hypothetical protein DSY46_02845 [Hydrogenimonas sp.]|nr:MAG: hypothetical protein DSY46_02845 [Hydrogenimonas sp.]